MEYTDKKYFIQDKLVSKLDLIANRVSKHQLDALILIDGDEGYGKSNLSVGVAYYIAWKTGRKFTVDDVHFKLKEFVDTVKSTEDKVFVFDEAVLVGMAMNWQNKNQQLLRTLLMMARKKRHVIIFNIPKFHVLQEYFVERAIALLHVYARKEQEIGKFCYYKKEAKNNLFEEIRKTKKKPYRLFYTFYGTFSEALPKCIDEKEYESKKDEAIMSLGQKEQSLGRMDVFNMRLRYRLSQFAQNNGLSKTEFANQLGVRRKTLNDWEEFPKMHPDVFENKEIEVIS